MEKYVLALDLALSTTGATVFSNDAKIIENLSVETKSEKTHQAKLNLIANFLLNLKEKYSFEKIIFERGFYRFAASTQAVYKVCGVAQYIFWNIPQVFYPPATVKKIVGGKGNIKKDELREIIEKKYGVSFSNNDESDSCAVGLCYFYKEGII